MRIGLIGYYGHSNYGDDRILYCIKKYFSNHEFIIANAWYDAKDKLNLLNSCDYILIGGGGIILKDIARHADLFRNLIKPFGLIGVSVESESKNMGEVLKIIEQRADFILVRDCKSKEYFNNSNKVIIGPDLTFLYPFDVVEEVKEDVCGLNLLEWHYWQRELFGTYNKIMLRLDRIFPFIERLYPLRKWDSVKTVAILKNSFKKILTIPFYSEKSSITDHDALSKHFVNVPPTFDHNLYKKIRYLIGMRYHSIIFATQCGIPFISLSYQPKNIKFCTDMDLEDLSVKIYNINELEKKIGYIKENHSEIRSHLLSYREKSTKEIIGIFDRISKDFMKIQ